MKNQESQLQTTLDTAREILRATTTNQEVLVGLLRKASILVATLDNFKIGFSQTYIGLAKVFDRLGVLTNFYDSHRDWILDGLKRVDNALNTINTDVPRIIWNLGNFITNIRNLLLPPGASAVPVPEKALVATDMCVPIPGRTC